MAPSFDAEPQLQCPPQRTPAPSQARRPPQRTSAPTLELSQASLQGLKFLGEFSRLLLNRPSNGLPNPELLPRVPAKSTGDLSLSSPCASPVLTTMKQEGKV